MMKMRTQRGLLLTGAAVALSIALSGCAVINNVLGIANRDEETGQVAENTNIDVFSIKLGDCMLDSGSEMVTNADILPCADPHDQEVFHEIKMEDGEFDEAAIDAAADECVGDAFTIFVGLSYQESVYDVTTLSPTKESWENNNDRVIQCLIYDPEGQTTGSLAGIAR